MISWINPYQLNLRKLIGLLVNLSARPIRTKGKAFEQDSISVYHLLSRTFANNWSFTPRSEAEFLEEARDLQNLIDPDVFPVAEYNGEMVGFFWGYLTTIFRLNASTED